MVSGNPCYPRVDRVTWIGIPVSPPSNPVKRSSFKISPLLFLNMAEPSKSLTAAIYPS